MEQIKIVQVNGNNEDFRELCLMLEKFQHQLLPALGMKGYTLTDDLQDIKGFLLYHNGVAIGSIGIKRVDTETCEIVRVYVCDEYRGKGYAKMLFAKIEEYAKKLGYKRAEMVTWAASTAALSLYRKLGYTCSEEKLSEWFKGLKYIELHKNLC